MNLSHGVYDQTEREISAHFGSALVRAFCEAGGDPSSPGRFENSGGVLLVCGVFGRFEDSGGVLVGVFGRFENSGGVLCGVVSRL